ncbi:outer membrane lipoprotein carrier protein LolA [Elizabethkingia sp. JS20170427COW]|uniref:LolA family protein n=1 Tax=Elizabethkingia sp. JS20170427COW TaxID=2583851 RepID=UPI00111097CD|nr:outer membrane lipoprotein carrier protein LolA [Elizabethkingia sp. JS20170427COW]QCX53651.1 outer membrane lipoprotein carrier protein LolA [Elizabethkingia sp. JS20170427COW]
MLKIIRKAFLGSLIIASGLMLAQKTDAKAKNILDHVSSYYKSKKNTYFKFIFSSNHKRETGIFYNQGEKYKLKIMGVEQIYDGNKVYNINGEEHEVTIAKSSDSEVMFSPLSYLESYKKGYSLQYLGKKTLAGKKVDLIKMIPTSNNGIKYVNLYIDSVRNHLVKLEQYTTDGGTSTIQITKYVENQNLSSNLFHFNKANYKNYLITEL